MKRMKKRHDTAPEPAHRRRRGGAWTAYCPHDDCPHYRGEDIPCDRVGRYCETAKAGAGLPGRY